MRSRPKKWAAVPRDGPIVEAPVLVRRLKHLQPHSRQCHGERGCQGHHLHADRGEAQLREVVFADLAWHLAATPRRSPVSAPASHLVQHLGKVAAAVQASGQDRRIGDGRAVAVRLRAVPRTRSARPIRRRGQPPDGPRPGRR